MRKLILLAAFLLPAMASAQTAKDIIETALEKQIERWQSVDSYAVTQTVMGSTSKILYQRRESTRPDGRPKVEFVPASSADMNDMSDPDEDLMELIDEAELVGRESIGGREAFHLKASDVGEVQDMGNGDFTIESMSVWIDTADYVPLRMTMNGTVAEAGEERPGKIVVNQEDYRNVPGSKMYESYRQTVAIESVMSEQDRAQMEQARAELEKFEEQLAAMPESQRAMMEQMMGPQIEAMRSMVTDGGINLEIVIDSIEVNPE